MLLECDGSLSAADQAVLLVTHEMRAFAAAAGTSSRSGCGGAAASGGQGGTRPHL